jgi:cytochrome o ubiquinol oxidase operon protein cyoD
MNANHVAGWPSGTFGTYLLGFILAIVLTAIPFALVMTSALPLTPAVVILVVLAAVQIVVHLVLFLHLDRWSALRHVGAVFAYTLVILAILVGATVWIMYHLTTNLMPR